jgi:hypothetical protein
VKPWRRIGPTKNGSIFLPKECVEFLLNLPITYNVKIMSGGVTFSKILELFGTSSETEGTTSIQGFKRGSFWDLMVTKNTQGEPDMVSQCGKPVPILTEAENVIGIFVMTVDGHPTDGVLTGMWR